MSMTAGQKDIVQETAGYVRQKFGSESSGHDWWHMYRVWQLAKTIAASEPQADPFITELAALVHDVADAKLVKSEEAARQEIRDWLAGQGLSVEDVQRVVLGITNISFSSTLGDKTVQLTPEAQIVSDADKLDGIGAIGIARAFTYGGSKNSLIYDPDSPPRELTDAADYHANAPATINHFYEKLLLLKDRMYTATAKELAQERHTYMERFLEEFLAEWDGKR